MCLLILLFEIFFVDTSVYADNFFQSIIDSGKRWESMAANSSNNIDTTNITDTIGEITRVVKAIGVGIFMVAIVVTIIASNMKNTGQDIAGMKITLAFIFGLSLLFIFSDSIISIIMNIFNGFESMNTF